MENFILLCNNSGKRYQKQKSTFVALKYLKTYSNIYVYNFRQGKTR